MPQAAVYINGTRIYIYFYYLRIQLDFALLTVTVGAGSGQSMARDAPEQGHTHGAHSMTNL